MQGAVFRRQGSRRMFFRGTIGNCSATISPYFSEVTILKQYSIFFRSKYFKISHPYFVNYIKKNNICPKYIKLIPKNIPDLFKKSKNNIIQLFCELIKINHAYFGKIFCFNIQNHEQCLVFQQIKFERNINNENVFDSKENCKYLFSISFLNDKEKKDKKNKKNKNKDNVLNNDGCDQTKKIKKIKK